MKIIKGWPPNAAKIRAAFPNLPSDVMLCYGDAVYVPDGGRVSPSLQAHERVHSVRQGRDPEGWWDRYIKDRVFRFNEELAAHKIEYAIACRTASGIEARRAILNAIAERLSGPLYGRMASFEVAKDMILGKVRA